MSDERTTSSGIGFTGLLAIAFIVLKLCKVIAWSWLWVLSPVWIPVTLLFTLGLTYLAYCIFYKWPDEKKRKKAGMSEIGWSLSEKSKWGQRVKKMQDASKN